MRAVPPRDLEERLIELVASTFWSCKQFVLVAFPWGQKGTFLEDEEGPDEWQTAALDTLDRELVKIARGEGDVGSTLRMAFASGHGVGKTAFMAWVVLWFMSTRWNTQAVITAGTQTQLKTKTWREVKKWLDLVINKHWFEWTHTQLKCLYNPELWVANSIPWSENNPQAFAGTHEIHVLYLFDEASTIVDVIWETSEGAFTTPGNIWLAFGQRTLASGRFHECWTKFRHRWVTFEIDARKAKHADKKQIEEWIADYGIDSDFVRVRVLGLPPRTGALQFIPTELVEAAMLRWKSFDPRTIPSIIPKLFGIDVGGGGQGKTVICLRRGPFVERYLDFHEADMTRVAAWINQQLIDYQPDVAFIDAHGLGKGVYDMLVLWGRENVVPCYSGRREETLEPMVWYNPRTEWWARIRLWLRDGMLPYHVTMRDDLTAPQSYPDMQHVIRLETKEQLAKRGIPSPDYGDALALTFAQLVPAKLMGAEDTDNVEPEQP